MSGRGRARLWLGLLPFVLLAGCSDAPSRPRGVVLVSVDTLRADALGAYGAGAEASPTFDRIAAEGLLFERATSTAPWTLPAHASMLTGLYPRQHGVQTEYHVLPEEVPTLSAWLERHGFATKGIVNIGSAGDLREETTRRMVLRGSHKLIHEAGSDAGSLYDLAADPGEREDRAAHDADRLARLRADLERYRRQRPVGSAVGRELEPGERERLRALGYAR